MSRNCCSVGYRRKRKKDLDNSSDGCCSNANEPINEDPCNNDPVLPVDNCINNCSLPSTGCGNDPGNTTINNTDNFLVDHLQRFIGETVTIFTTSGGQSGSGFTGILASVNFSYVRLITRIGPAPACSLGNCCPSPCGNEYEGYEDGFGNYGNNYGKGNCVLNTVGSVTDIPVNLIAAFVHNAV